MAYTEKLLPVEALFASWQNRRQGELQDNSAAKEIERLQNEMLKQQIEAAKWDMLDKKSPATMTVPSSGLGGMPTKKYLSELSGYISGVSPTDTFNQWNQNFRQGMAGGGGYGGRGGRDDQGAAPAPTMEYYGPDHSAAPDVTTAASKLAELYSAPQDNLGGGAMSNPTTGTYKEFSQNPTSPIGKYVDASGGETTTGPSAAADYQSGLAGKAEVENILKQREMAPGKQAEAKAQVLNNAAKSISGDPRFKALDDEIKSKILGNIGKIVEDNIKSNGTPILEVGDVIAKYGK